MADGAAVEDVGLHGAEGAVLLAEERIAGHFHFKVQGGAGLYSGQGHGQAAGIETADGSAVEPQGGFAVAVPQKVDAAFPGGGDDYLAARSQKFRKNLKRYRRKLEQMGRPELARLGPDDDARGWMNEVLEVNDASWKAERGTNLFRHPSLWSFFVDLVGEMAPRGLIDLHLLRIDGRAVAYELLGPPRVSKLLYEAHLLERCYGTVAAVLEAEPAGLATAVEAYIDAKPPLRRRILSVGIPILLPDGERLIGVLPGGDASANSRAQSTEFHVILNWHEELKARVPLS